MSTVKDASTPPLPSLGEAKEQPLLTQWNDTAAEYPRDKRLHVLFEEQVERTPVSLCGDRCHG